MPAGVVCPRALPVQTRARPCSAGPNLPVRCLAPAVGSARGLAIHQAHTAPPILPSSSTHFPSHLNPPALLDSGCLRRLATLPYGRARYAAGRAPSSPASRGSHAARSARHLPQGLALGIHRLGVQIIANSPTPSSSPDLRSRARAARRLVPFLPWSRSERADINNTDNCSGVRGIIVPEPVGADSQRPRTCPSPTRSAPLLSSTSVPLPGALRVSTPPPAPLLLPPCRIPLHLYPVTQ
ncbi:hypothetical protein B0H14DRAFT_3496079 [Mycena olivaceomarginata]|nr:hypothetical protein B0H14DRAFT_3496079 [Mycena olivaceomarginata]